VDVILVSETHLNAGYIPNIPSYAFYRNDRQTGRGGGTGIYVKRCIDHHALDTPALRKNIEATCVAIQTNTLGTLKIVSAYNPPGCHLKDTDLDALLNSTGPVILGGDLNAMHAAWNSRRENAIGRELQNYALRRNDTFILGPTEPTLYHSSGHMPDVIDIVVHRRLNANVEVTTLIELSSDHNPVLIEIGGPSDCRTTTKKVTCWPRFAELILDELPSVPSIRANSKKPLTY
jgi:endonuclease/exonuclease/phosphatase family metal-dependent hydrolase